MMTQRDVRMGCYRLGCFVVRKQMSNQMGNSFWKNIMQLSTKFHIRAVLRNTLI
jgi:hypothetical protein